MLPSDEGLKLHLLVYDSTRELCRVALPLASVENIEHLFPPDDLRAVKEQGVDFASVQARVRERGLIPQTLIDTHTAARSYRIWIG